VSAFSFFAFIPFLLFLTGLFVVKEEEAENKYTDQHGEGAGIIGKSGDDESFILIVAKRADCDSLNFAQGGVAESVVVQAESEDTINIGDLESGLEGRAGSLFLEESANIRIKHHEFELNVTASVGHPRLSVPLFNINKVFNVFLDGVEGTRGALTNAVVANITRAKDTLLTKSPHDQALAQFLITRLLESLGCASSRIPLHTALEELVAEELQRTREGDTGVVPCLQSRDQYQVPSLGSARKIALLRCTVCSGRSTQNGKQQVVSLDGVSNTTEQNGGARLASNNSSILKKVVSYNESVITIEIGLVEVEVIHNEGVLILKLNTAFLSNFSYSISHIRSTSNQNVVSVINKVEDSIKSNLSSEFFCVRGEDYKNIIQVLAIRGKGKLGAG